jgi:hypothetical protein
VIFILLLTAALALSCQSSSINSYSPPSADSFDLRDMTKIADVPPFILLRKAYKEMRDAGTLPPRGTRLTVLPHRCPAQLQFIIKERRLQLKDVEPFMKNLEAVYRAQQQDAFNLPENMTEARSANQQDIKLVLPQIPPASFSRLIAGLHPAAPSGARSRLGIFG